MFYFILSQMKDQLIYQPDSFGSTTYRIVWFGGESTQLHFQKWCLLPPPNHTKRSAWVDIDVRTLMDMPTRVKDLYEEMRDYYNYGICLEQEYLESLMKV